VNKTAAYFWSKNGKEEFEGFFERYAPMFKDAPMKEVGGEQDLEFYAIFQKYLRLYETVLEGYIEKLDASQEEFYRELQAVQDDANIKDKKLLHFVNYLIGCTDYPSFYKMMVRAAKKWVKAEAKAEAASGDGAGAGDLKAEGKGEPRSEAGGKGTADEDAADSKESHK
jgi:hypothetical protein